MGLLQPFACYKYYVFNIQALTQLFNSYKMGQLLLLGRWRIIGNERGLDWTGESEPNPQILLGLWNGLWNVLISGRRPDCVLLIRNTRSRYRWRQALRLMGYQMEMGRWWDGMEKPDNGAGNETGRDGERQGPAEANCGSAGLFSKVELMSDELGWALHLNGSSAHRLIGLAQELVVTLSARDQVRCPARRPATGVPSTIIQTVNGGCGV